MPKGMLSFVFIPAFIGTPKQNSKGPVFIIIHWNIAFFAILLGIAGAFLSILGISFIQDIVKWREEQTPAEILNALRKRIKRIFMDSGSNSRNGMDMSFCTINTDSGILQYSGAFNPIFIMRNNEITKLSS